MADKIFRKGAQLTLHSAKIFISIFVIVSLILALAFFTNHFLLSDAQSLEGKISLVESNTKAENWERAEKELTKILKEWPTVENKWALLLDHAEIDNIEDALTRVAEYIKAKDVPLALAELASLKNYITHIPEKESLNLKNIF